MTLGNVWSGDTSFLKNLIFANDDLKFAFAFWDFSSFCWGNWKRITISAKVRERVFHRQAGQGKCYGYNFHVGPKTKIKSETNHYFCEERFKAQVIMCFPLSGHECHRAIVDST